MLDEAKTTELLKSVADLLESYMGKDSYYLDSGTLLGIYRDKAINKFDHDIDIRVFEDVRRI